jgi:hypothetical protein
MTVLARPKRWRQTHLAIYLPTLLYVSLKVMESDKAATANGE